MASVSGIDAIGALVEMKVQPEELKVLTVGCLARDEVSISVKNESRSSLFDWGLTGLPNNSVTGTELHLWAQILSKLSSHTCR